MDVFTFTEAIRLGPEGTPCDMFRLFLIEIAMIFPLALGGYSLFSGGVLFFGGHIISLLIGACLYRTVTALLSPIPPTPPSHPFPPAPPAPSRPTLPVKRRQKPQYRGFIFLPLLLCPITEAIVKAVGGLLTNPSAETLKDAIFAIQT